MWPAKVSCLCRKRPVKTWPVDKADCSIYSDNASDETASSFSRLDGIASLAIPLTRFRSYFSPTNSGVLLQAQPIFLGWTQFALASDCVVHAYGLVWSAVKQSV